jgi:7-cyano-7-deazaguanine synthase
VKRLAPQALVVLSGGLDSAVNLVRAQKRFQSVQAIFFNYGQRAAQAELKAARWLCRHYAAPLLTVKLPWMERITHTALVNRSRPLPRFKAGDLSRNAKTRSSARAVWVPNRNGAFINVAASYADAYNIPRIVVGFNREEAATFPDNSAAFVARANAALRFSTQAKTKVISFTLAMDKTDIMREALRLGLDINRTYSCYEKGPQPCGACESCLRKQRALKKVLP